MVFLADTEARRDLLEPLRKLLTDLVEEVFSPTFQVDAKGEDGLDLVTSVDLTMQDRLSGGLAKLLPGSLVVGEEGFEEVDGEGPVWLVDPLDGTVNFVAGLPSYAVSVVLLHGGRPVLAAVHDVPHRATFSAAQDVGAYLNGEPLVRRESRARLSVVSSGLMRDLGARAPVAITALLDDFKLRNFGSQALHLCYAAAGHLSLVASREAKGWDDMAGALIAREAGLHYGSYHPAADFSPRTDSDQFSLCAPSVLFKQYAPLFAQSVGREAR